MTTQLIVDNDTAQDDCVTLMIALLDDAVDLRAITTVAGNVDFDRQVMNAHMTLSACGRLGDVAIHPGCRQPLLHEWASAEDVHGDGSGGLTMDVDGLEVSDEHGVDALIRHAAQAEGELCIVAIGPLTNIAMAAAKDRAFAGRVKHLYVMGGSNNGRGNITPAAEFNFYVDPLAAQIVFEAGFDDLVVFPWDPLTLRDATYPRARYDELTRIDTPLAKFFGSVCDTTLAFNEAVGVDGSTHPDSIALAAMLYPELILASAPYRVDVEYRSELTRGYSSMGWDKFAGAANATVVERFDGAAFYDYLASILRRRSTPSRPLRGARFS